MSTTTLKQKNAITWLVTNSLSAFHWTTIPASIQGPFIACNAGRFLHGLCIPTKNNTTWGYNLFPAKLNSSPLEIHDGFGMTIRLPFERPGNFYKSSVKLQGGYDFCNLTEITHNATQTTLRRFSGYTKINASNRRKWADPWIYRYRLVVKGWVSLCCEHLPRTRSAFKPAEK